MTTQTATLTDFLLARIAEDEADYRCMSESLRVAATSVTARGATTTAETILHRDKMLAECHAKWRIVEQCSFVVDMERVPIRPGVYGRRPIRAVTDIGDEILPLLALPYADHPDYREEWKP